MTQYKEAVEEQRIRLAAAEWAKGVKNIHIHGISSMWYDYRPQDTKDGQMVTDIQYNDGRIERKLKTGEVINMGKEMTEDELIVEYQKSGR